MQKKVKEAPPFAGTIIGRESPDMALAAKLFDAFSDPTRMSILALLVRREEMNVGEIVEAVGAPQPRISNHLSCLAWCGYVKARREGKRVYYSIADDRVLKVLALGEELLRDNLEHVEACGTTRVSGLETDSTTARRTER
jgi:DNA-binding transcriptional ArsR family regulator